MRDHTKFEEYKVMNCVMQFTELPLPLPPKEVAFRHKKCFLIFSVWRLA